MPNPTPGNVGSNNTPASNNASTKQQLEQLNTMREALFSQDGWGCVRSYFSFYFLSNKLFRSHFYKLFIPFFNFDYFKCEENDCLIFLVAYFFGDWLLSMLV